MSEQSRNIELARVVLVREGKAEKGERGRKEPCTQYKKAESQFFFAKRQNFIATKNFDFSKAKNISAIIHCLRTFTKSH